MDLRSFVTQVLLDIVGGVTDAQERTAVGVVVPESRISDAYETIRDELGPAQRISFEVSVRAEESDGSEAKISVVSTFLGAGVAKTKSKEAGHSSVLRFQVPIKLPTSEMTHHSGK